MACTWRIRHKLILGLSLVVAIMGLLLGGTLYGLASYRSAMGTCNSKLEELDEAVKIKEEIRKLNGPFPNPAIRQAQIQHQIPEIEKALDRYNEKLLETVERRRALDGGKQERDFVEIIRSDLKELALTISKQGSMVVDIGDGQNPGTLDETIQAKVTKLEREASDLIGTITRLLNKTIDTTRSEAQKSIWLCSCTGVAAVLLMAGLLRFFYRWVATPIRELEEGVSRVARGDFQHQIEIHSGDEIEDLAKSYNEMTDKLRAMYENLAQQVNDRSRQLVRSEQLAGVGFLAAGVAHEINNPLASIAFSSEALESRLSDLLRDVRLPSEDRETIAKYLKMIQEEAFRCKEITQKLLAYSRGGERSRERTDLVEVVEGVLDMVKHLQNCKGKRVDFHPAGPLHAWINAQEIKQVFLNLAINAFESMDEGGVLTITHRSVAGSIELTFTDTGCGMTPDVLENIFEPFFTRSRTGKGTGLGLSISHRIIASHGGEIEATSAGPGKGSTFRVRLPIQPPANATDGGDVQDPVEEFLKLSSAKRKAA